MAEEQMPMTPLPGYTPANKLQIEDASKLKQQEERILRDLDDLELMGDYDMRWLAIAKTHIQQGFMAAVRAVMRPSRINLPEDDEEEGEEL